jgi:hypothetical protein
MMLECVKPAAPNPTISIEYNDLLAGTRSNSLDLPMLVTSFNEAYAMQPAQFKNVWDSLASAEQQAVEVIQVPGMLDPASITEMLSSVLKFGVTNMPDSSATVVYAASSLKTGATNQAGEKINIGRPSVLVHSYQCISPILRIHSHAYQCTHSFLYV